MRFFIQDTSEKYTSRISELGHRILFVVGGADSIVKTKSLVDASPRKGINMVQVEGLGHFLAREGKDQDCPWATFWFPNIMNLIVKFSTNMGNNHIESLRFNWGFIKLLNDGRSRDRDMKADHSTNEEERENEILESADFSTKLTKIAKIFSEKKK